MASSVSTAGNGYNFKVVLLGEGCVGKTSVALRYVEDKFNDRHISTLQVINNASFTLLISLVLSNCSYAFDRSFFK